MHHSDALVDGPFVSESLDQGLASSSLSISGSSRIRNFSLPLPLPTSESTGVARSLLLASQPTFHRAVRSESSILLETPARWNFMIAHSDSLLSKRRANELWNEKMYQRLTLLESERVRTFSQISELRNKLASAEQKLFQSEEAVKRIEKKRETDFAYAVEHAKLVLTRGGWDMKNQLMLCESFDNKQRIAQLEEELSAVTATISKNKKQLATCRSRIQALKKTNDDLRLMAYRGTSTFEHCIELTTPAFLREWTVKFCLMRCIVALAAERFVDAERHSLDALNMALHLHKGDLKAECQYWRRVVLHPKDQLQDAFKSTQNVRNGSKTGSGASSNANSPPQMLGPSPNGHLSLANFPKHSAEASIPLTPIQECSLASTDLPADGFNNGLSNVNIEIVQLTSNKASLNNNSGNTLFSSNNGNDENLTIPSCQSEETCKENFESCSGDEKVQSAPASPGLLNERLSIAAPKLSPSVEKTSSTLPWTTVPSLTTDLDTLSRGNSSPELPIDGSRFESINELINPIIADDWSSQRATPTLPPDDVDYASLNSRMNVPDSFTARRYATNKSIKSWRLRVPPKHLDALGALPNLPSGERSALPKPTYEIPPTPPDSFSPEEKSPMKLRRNNSWGDMRSLVKGLGQRKQIAEAEAASMIKLVKHLAMREDR